MTRREKVREDLRRLYGSVADEPVPDDMKELLDKLADVSSASPRGGGAQERFTSPASTQNPRESKEFPCSR